jgi:hypothetical protein
MANQIFTSTTNHGKADVTVAPVIAALEDLLALGGAEQDGVSGAVWSLQRDAVIARPTNRSETLACLLALRAEVEEFPTHVELCDRLSPDVEAALYALERRWIRAIDNATAALARDGAVVPPAFNAMFGIPATRGGL